MGFYNIFFSPTGGTEKVADIVAKGTKLDAEEIDLIKEPDKLMKVKFEKKRKELEKTILEEEKKKALAVGTKA